MRITPVVFLVFLATADTLPAAPPTGSPPSAAPTPAAPSPGSPSPSGGVGLSVAATRDLTAQELLDRYDQSMAALRNSRVTCTFRRKAEMSWKAPWWSVSELTVQREEGERIRLTWRRRAPWPAPRD